MTEVRTVTISVPEVLAQRIEKITKTDLENTVQHMVMNWFEDNRRSAFEVKRLGICWHEDVYAALLKYVGQGGISRYVRDAVYQDLKRVEKDLTPLPAWKESIEPKSVKKFNRKIRDDRTSVHGPMVFPMQWLERIEARYPRQVSTYVKAVTQKRLEKDFNLNLPVQKGMGQFL